MLKKSSQPNSNSLDCVNMMLLGAKKRRQMAYAVVKSINVQMGETPKLVLVK